jgi:hypothetical protein
MVRLFGSSANLKQTVAASENLSISLTALLYSMAQVQESHHLPSCWDQLSQDDKAEFVKLKGDFHRGQKSTSKDRRITTFHRELQVVLDWLERSDENKEIRCIIAGICFAGPYICINTRQLKCFLCRCKSSINGCFQQLGFVALRTKSKGRNCVLSVLPSLCHQQDVLRQWAVRWASDNASFCFVSSFSSAGMPPITEDDLVDHRGQSNPRPLYQRPPPAQAVPMFAQKAAAPFKPRVIDFELPSLDDGFDGPDLDPVEPWKLSLSMDNLLPEFEESFEMVLGGGDLKRSGSAVISMKEWRIFCDDEITASF